MIPLIFSACHEIESFALAITPWIAVISCDTNATDSSPKTDIFTLAKERGATGAVSI